MTYNQNQLRVWLNWIEAVLNTYQQLPIKIKEWYVEERRLTLDKLLSIQLLEFDRDE